VVGETPAEPESQPAAAPGDNPAPFAGNLYRHGLELRVSGSYADLGAYVAALERLRPRLLWSGLELDATRHPKVELKLKLYTLSLEKAWLAL
jgi:MSHA biogenesis protein MshJ